MLKAVLFDLDGVLIETEKETFEFYKKELAKQNIFLKESDFQFKAGRKSVDFWQSVLTPQQREEVDTKKLVCLKRDLFNKYPDRYVKKVEGSEELLKKIKESGYKIGLSSQNEKRMIDTILDWMNIREYFDVVVSIDDIKELKPNPEIYLYAAIKLGVTPDEVVVIEDSLDGVNAAKNAKMSCIGVRHSYTPEGSLANADFIVDKLLDIMLRI